MKVTYNWLKDFVEIKVSPKELAEKLTMAGLEVNSLVEKGNDAVFEIEVTSNRPDWLSVIGIAREVAAITGRKMRIGSRLSVLGSPIASEHRAPSTEHLKLEINIEDKLDCPLYTAKIIQGVRVGPSPDWLKERLELIGCRSINNLVDVTNYILFTYGQPLHVFDLDKVSCQLSHACRQAGVVSCQKKIVIRRAKNKEEIVTIDGIKRTLDESVLVIADEKNPIAIAGVIGGKDSEVTQETKNILLEAAVFNSALVRRGRQKLGVQTDSSYRFERGVNSESLDSASWQAVRLISELSGGKTVLAKKSASSIKVKNKNIKLSSLSVQETLGAKIRAAKIKTILQGLGFQVKISAKNIFNVSVPNFRQDIKLDIDLIEEIARIFSFGNIPSTLPSAVLRVISYGKRDFASSVKNILVGLGLQEVITYSLLEKDLSLFDSAKGASGEVEILNPLSQQQAVLRETLMPSLVRCLSSNLNRKQEYVAIFEVAKRFMANDSGPKEELSLGIALCGEKPLFLETGVVKDKITPLHLKGILEVLFERLGIEDYNFQSEDSSSMYVDIKQERIGQIVILNKQAQDKFDIKGKIVVTAEFSLEKILPFVNLNKQFVALPVYPGISRDISFILKDEIAASELIKEVKENSPSLLKEVKIADYYKGKQIPSGFKGLTLACFYRLDERTLTEEEINPAHSAILSLLSDKFGIQVR